MTPTTHDPEERVIETLVWTHAELELELAHDADTPLHLRSLRCGTTSVTFDLALPLVHVLTPAAGHVPASYRLTHTALSSALRVVGSEARRAGPREDLEVTSVSAQHGVEVVLRLSHHEGTGSWGAVTSVRNTGDAPLVLRAVTSFACALGATAGATAASDAIAGWELTSGRSDWLGEARWSTRPLRELLPPIAQHLTGHNPRGAIEATSTGTWSTGASLPVGVLAHAEQQLAWAWQVEHNGPWRWEVAEDTAGGWLALAGPTDEHASWTTVLAPGESFDSVPVSLAVAADAESAVASLTRRRRATRREHEDNLALPVVFNDYMNTLDGDPTTAKLLPLVTAAAQVGAEIFCIDAGWYDDSGHWWDTVGEWLPSTTRFPNGLGEVVSAIRAAGMTPGLWLEPEVIGVNSPMADRLPLEAFLQRHGVRIVEHDRFHLDLRHPAARAHLDEVVDRLVDEFGVGFFKLDYNIDPGPGTDLDADSVGDGLLRHNRAHLAWLDGVLDRHPHLVIENCSSGAMRTDFAMLSRLAMQSTSDQQDYRLYPPIAAASPLSMLPEQAASWAYPQPGMTAEQASFCLVTGMLGRYYVSGHLNRMTDGGRALVAEAIGAAKQVRKQLSHSLPFWPSGLPSWDEPWVSLGLHVPDGDLVSVWRRGGSETHRLHLPAHRGHEIEVATIFPNSLPPWATAWDPMEGVLTVDASCAGEPFSARTFLVTPAGVRTDHDTQHRPTATA